ncbi:MAG: hypothetical protein HY902_19715 [Deltaproteobacteria bacterium]|nr:hypothetical protein [Deltaproteobacteria bacterium]
MLATMRPSATIAATWLLALALNPGCGTAPTNGGGTSATATDIASGGADTTTADALAGTDASTVQDGTLSDGSTGDTAGCPEGNPCDDGKLCTTGDHCQGGVCVGTLKDCSGGVPACKVGTCEPNSGLCLVSDKQGECDDGNPCTEADSCILGACSGFPIAGCCQPSCKGKVCGDDGCGKPCGSCKPGEVCGNGACVKDQPAGETCQDALEIPSLPYQHAGTTKGRKNDLDVPSAACYSSPLGTYSPDVVYRYTAAADTTIGIALSGYDNKPAFYVLADCGDAKNSCLVGQLGYGQSTLGPSYAAVKKGQTVFIVVDADDNGGDYTLDVSSCTPNCSNKQCGTDGCGGVCGYCPKLSSYECSTAGTCVCVPNCYQKSCGSDGCGGTCGSKCGPGLECDDGSMQGQFTGNCVKPGQLGDTCKNAIPATISPFTYNGDTTGLGNNLYAWSFCQGNGTSAYYGDEAPDQVFALGGKVAGTWLVELTKASTMLEIYAVTDCSDPISCQQAGYHGYTLKKQLLVESPANAPIFVVVDGYSQQYGTYTLKATHCLAPSDCPDATPGDYCTLGIEVATFPFKANGTVGIDSYFLPKGACGAPKVLGKGGGNTAYRFKAVKTGTYTVKVVGTGGMDPIVYAAKDCTNLATTCAGYADKTGLSGTETLAISAQAGEEWFAVVDAPTSVNGTFSIEITGP